jgi:hypothetical protein
MWIVLIVTVIVLLSAFAWVVSRDKMICPVCSHPLSDHIPQVVDGVVLGAPYCKRCERECR